MDEKEKSNLDLISRIYTEPDASQKVDAIVQRFDMEKLFPAVVGPLVLEMGVGDGVWTEKIVNKFGRTHVVDVSEKLLTLFQTRFGARATGFLSFFEDFTPAEGMRFNTVIASHVLEHVQDPIRVLHQMKSWLAPNGRVIVVVPNAESIHRKLAVRMGLLKAVHELGERDFLVGHRRVYDLTILREHVCDAGFQILEEHGLFLKTLPNAMMKDFSLELLSALSGISDELPASLMANIAMVLSPG